MDTGAYAASILGTGRVLVAGQDFELASWKMRKPRLALDPSITPVDSESPDVHEEAGRLGHLKAHLRADALHKSLDICGQGGAEGPLRLVLPTDVAELQ